MSAGAVTVVHRRSKLVCLTRALCWPVAFFNLIFALISILAPFELLVKIPLMVLSAAAIAFALRLELNTSVSFVESQVRVSNSNSSYSIRPGDLEKIYCGRISNGQLGPRLPGLVFALRDGSIIQVQCSVGNSMKNRRAIHAEVLQWARRNHVAISLPDLGPMATWVMTR